MFRKVRPPFTVRHLIVCTNQRDPSSGKPSCGMNGSVELRERLKKAVKARGLKGQVLVTGSSCLGYCPPQGCAVGILPDDEWGIVDVTPEDESDLLDRICQGAVPEKKD